MVIFLAGIEQKECIKVSGTGCIPYAFYTYFYLRKNKETTNLMIENRHNHKVIFIDSGAHSFFTENHSLGISATGFKKKKAKKQDSPEEYFEKYIAWLIENIDYIDYFAELDIGELVGQETVLGWRKRLKEAGIYNKCVTVYHPKVMTFDNYIEMLEDSESKYIALEGDRKNRNRLPYNELIMEAYSRGIKVHGFAMTKSDIFLKYGFYSVDSASWKSGTMYGTLSTFKHMTIKTIDCKDKKEVFKIKKINLELLNHEEYKTNSQYKYQIAAEGYNRMSEFLTKVWVKRGVIW